MPNRWSGLKNLSNLFTDEGTSKMEKLVWRSLKSSGFYVWSVVCSVAQLCTTLCDPMGCSPPGSSVKGISQARILEWVAFPPPGDPPDPGIEPTSLVSPALAGQFFTAMPPGKPRCVLSVQFSSVAQSCLTLWPHGLQHARLPRPSPTPGAYSSSCPLSQWCHPTISSSLVPFSFHPQSFHASRSFQMSQFSASGGQGKDS